MAGGAGQGVASTFCRSKIRGADRPLLTAGWPEEVSLTTEEESLLFRPLYSGIHDIQDKVNKDNLPEDAFYHLQMNIDGSNRGV